MESPGLSGARLTKTDEPSSGGLGAGFVLDDLGPRCVRAHHARYANIPNHK
jgi:hypothetical protein